MSEAVQGEPLSYFLSDKNMILVVTFVGKMDNSSVSVLRKCRQELDALEKKKLVVFYFRDVTIIAGDAIPFLTQMQLATRTKHGAVSICSLKPPVREKLVRMGVVRGLELSDNLLDALQAFMRLQK